MVSGVATNRGSIRFSDATNYLLKTHQNPAKIQCINYIWSRLAPKAAGNVTVNRAQVIESEVFVYNLGTMYYIDDILYPEVIETMMRPASPMSTTTMSPRLTTNPDADIEPIPSELTTEAGDMRRNKDILLLNERDGAGSADSSDFDSDEDDGEIITPRALPVRFLHEPPK